MSLSGSITKVEVKDNTGFHLLYDGVTDTVYPITVAKGIGWELRVSTTAYSSTALWSTAVTIVYDGATQGKPASNTTSGTVSRVFDFDMGKMPETDIVFNIPKFWLTDYWNAGLPPEEDW